MLISILTCEQDLLLDREYRERVCFIVKTGLCLEKYFGNLKKAQKKKKQQTNMYISVYIYWFNGV
jgi:hypothetical protein